MENKISFEVAYKKLEEIAQKFKEVHYFCTHRVSEYHLWIKYINGKKRIDITASPCGAGEIALFRVVE